LLFTQQTTKLEGPKRKREEEPEEDAKLDLQIEWCRKINKQHHLSNLRYYEAKAREVETREHRDYFYCNCRKCPVGYLDWSGLQAEITDTGAQLNADDTWWDDFEKEEKRHQEDRDRQEKRTRFLEWYTQNP